MTGWRNFRGNLPALAAHFRYLILEFPGFGVSDDTGEHPWDLEVGCEGILVDETSYTAEEITADSYWGHKWDFGA